jgi:hypothetical protein
MVFGQISEAPQLKHRLWFTDEFSVFNIFLARETQRVKLNRVAGAHDKCSKVGKVLQVEAKLMISWRNLPLLILDTNSKIWSPWSVM